MSAAFVSYLAATIALLTVALVYWSRPAKRSLLWYRPGRSIFLLAVVTIAAGVVLWSVWLDQPHSAFERPERPIVIAIAFDLSPSMLAIPDPATSPDMAPRFQRGLSLLVRLLSSLEEHDQPVIVSVVGFAEQADIVMGWDVDTTQIRETLAYAVSPALFNSFGTSIEAAAVAVQRTFGLLPADLSDARRVVIVVSDGEDTMYTSSLAYATELFARLDAELFVVQTGLLDAKEGIPVYDGFGQFTRFHRIGDMAYTVPDADALRALANAAKRGTYLRAEDTDAAARIIPAILGTAEPALGLDRKSTAMLLLFLTVTALTGWILR